MAISIYSNNGKVNYGIKHYTLDYDKDLNNLPTNITPGSSAFITESSKKYMLNNQHKWVEVNLNGGSIIGNNSDDEDILIFDGNTPMGG